MRWGCFFHTKQCSGREGSQLDAPDQQSIKDRPFGNNPALEVFLNKGEKDLFEQTRYKDIKDNLTLEERKALTEFRSVSEQD